VRVRSEYSGFFEYEQTPQTRCPACQRTYNETVHVCPSCKRQTRPYKRTSPKQYRDFPTPYAEKTYALELETVACWLTLPAAVETQLEDVSRCRIDLPSNHIREFLKASPGFDDAADLASRLGLAPDEAKLVFSYYDRHRRALSAPDARGGHGAIPIYPAFYGQCLRHHLRQSLPEERALGLFARVSGYPALTDERHVCRNCVGSMLLPAAHTLNHLISLIYPTVALGDGQDLGMVSRVLHPQTQATTVFWYDNYDGGIGAAEKVFNTFDVLLHEALNSLNCGCEADEGCPLCTQTLRCERRNEALSKTAARGLIHQLLDLPAYVPADPLYVSEAEAKERHGQTPEQADGPVRPPSETPAAPVDPFDLLRVQPYVHDAVLEKALEVRGEEIGSEIAGTSIQELQAAYRHVLQRPRPSDWQFPAEWGDYQVLHIKQEASEQLAHGVYKTIVLHVHPDRNPDRSAWAQEVTKRVNAAWEGVKSREHQKEQRG
jgi:hypothetical protein